MDGEERLRLAFENANRKKKKKKILSFHLSASASYPHGPPSRFCRR